MDKYFAITRFIIVASLLVMGMTNMRSRNNVEASNASPRKSREKCVEYGKLVYSDEASPVLRIEKPASQDKKVSKCEIVQSPLIIGGVAAAPAEFPHMAVIGFGSDSEISWMCGGSIISEVFVLTAAHCLTASDKGPATKIRVGLTDLKKPEETGDFQERKIVESKAHPEYKVPSRYNDIALMKVDKPFKLGPRVRPACLETDSNLKENGQAIATGFGRTSNESPNGSDRLMKVSLDYVPTPDCERYFASEKGGQRMSKGLLVPNMLCAGFAQGGKDTCQGDSGGPLQRVLADPYCTYSIVGVTSFGKFCAQKNSPAVYTRVTSYIDWIEGIVWP